MCKPASGVFTKGHKAFWSKYSDSHEIIIEEHKLNADGIRGSNIVRFEIAPPNGDMSAPLDQWQYHLDDGMDACLPDWYDVVEAEKSARKMLKGWANQKIISGYVSELSDGEYYLIGTARIGRMSGTARIGSMSGTARIGRMSGTARIDCMSDTASVGSMYETARIGSMYETASVGRMSGDVTVITYIKMDLGCIVSANAVVVDRSCVPPKTYIGIQKKKGKK